MERSRTIVLKWAKRRRLHLKAWCCKDAALKTRYLVILHSAQGWSRRQIATALQCSPCLVSRVRSRWLEEGEAGLIDRREDNGNRKLTEEYLHTLLRVLQGTPPDYGSRRPTWTQRLLIDACRGEHGVQVSRSTMSRALQAVGARRGRPKPLAPCPWNERDRKRRIAMIHTLIDSLPWFNAAVWVDEADIDLNPRIGSDWMPPGVQRTVMTPGKNIKRYVAGAMDARSDQVTWVSGERKDSGLFINLLKSLLHKYPSPAIIHVILDNYIIHSSQRTQTWLREHGHRLRLHFLPPYCPDDNRIERCVWRELHQNVTYNHRQERIEDLMHEVNAHLRNHNRRHVIPAVAELRKAI